MGCSSSTAVKESGKINTTANKQQENGQHKQKEEISETKNNDSKSEEPEQHDDVLIAKDELKPAGDAERSEPDGESEKKSMPVETSTKAEETPVAPGSPIITVTLDKDGGQSASGVSGEGSASASSIDPFNENDDDGNEADIENDEIVDKFDTVSIISGRQRIGSSHRATQDTMNFIYRKTSTSQQLPPTIDNDKDSFATSPSQLPNFKKSAGFTNRRPSGVPPPVRAAKEGDVMTKFATGKLPFGKGGFQELGEEEEEEEEEDY